MARALHKHSPRAAQPFIALNTAAIPKDLLESELFGHERGAFTGAQATRRGRFEQAEGGTLFLDEIGDMPFDLQTRLLRVLSDGHFYRVGGHQPLKANVRVIAATHQNLEQRVRDGLFREDLYHRLNVIRLRLPSLRERREDIPILTRYFLTQSAKQLGAEVKRMSDHAMMFLSSLDLPGNVRQLENLCNWITVMAPGQTVEVKDLPQDLTDGGGFIQAAPGIMAGQAVTNGAARLQPVGSVNGSTGNASGAGGGTSPGMSGNIGAPGAFTNGAGGAGGGADMPANGVAPAEAHAGLGSGLPGNGHAAAMSNGAIPAGGAMGAPAPLLEKETWIALLEAEAARMLAAGRPEVMDALGRVFESTLIKTALRHTHGRKNDAAVRLGIGRNTITRKIQELGIDGAKED